MKKTYTFIAASVLFLFLTVMQSYSVTWTVQAFDFAFNPASLPSVHVGDTIKWQWINGMHHTTTSTSVPNGAATWNADLHSSSQTFLYVVTVPGNYSYVCTPHAPGMAGTFVANVIGIAPISGVIPEKFSLSQNFPNPFNPVTNIEFSVPRSSYVRLSVMSILGQQVELLVNHNLSPGTYVADWDASAFSSGIYFYKLEADGYVNTKRMILIK